MLFGLIKYKNECQIQVISNTTAVFYGDFVLTRQEEYIVSLKSDFISYSVFGSDLTVAAISKPRTVVRGLIERVDIL